MIHVSALQQRLLGSLSRSLEPLCLQTRQLIAQSCFEASTLLNKFYGTDGQINSGHRNRISEFHVTLLLRCQFISSHVAYALKR